MSQTRRLIRQTMTIARRDFIATVFTPIFLLFLFAPLIMVAFSTIGALGAAQAADHGSDRVRIVAIVSDATATAFAAADRQSRTIFRRDEEPPELVTLPPHAIRPRRRAPRSSRPTMMRPPCSMARSIGPPSCTVHAGSGRRIT
ncbi:hypothetical protein GCM10020258_25630 [Sphingomonas yabuuchiae]